MPGKSSIQKTFFDYQLFFELSPDLFCIAGFDGYFRKVNAAVSTLLEYSNDELLAMPINELIYSDDKHITAYNRTELINGKPLLSFENRYVTKSGEIVWLSWTSLAVEAQQVVYAIAKNITHTKKIEEDRTEVIRNLTKINSDLKLLTYTTSHDLRSPVNNLIAVFNMLDASKINHPETLEFIDILKAATANLKATLNNYTDILNDKNTVTVEQEMLQFNACFNNVRRSLSTIIEHSAAVIRCDFSEVQSVRFNKGYLESIFLNLLTNAIKYARPGNCPNIEMYSKKEQGLTQLIFADTGRGFDMEKVKDKLFGFGESFHTNTDSKGIGLYLVYNHIIDLGGKIAIESKVNEGAKFTITFRD